MSTPGPGPAVQRYRGVGRLLAWLWQVSCRAM